MTLHDAILNIGHDPNAYFRKLSELSKPQKILLAERFLNLAKQDSKKLMQKHHPDRGGSHDEFVKVSSSFDVIESETRKFVGKVQDKINEETEARAKMTHIVLG